MELVVRILRNSEATLKTLFRSPWPPGSSPSLALEPAYAGLFPHHHHQHQPSENFEDKKSEGFLWGVPKKRRTTEVRMSRKIGAHNWTLKIFKPKTNLRICENCGHHYEAKHLCRNCYDKVKAETEEIRNKIESQLGDNPEDRGVIVLYGNEKERINPKMTGNNNIIVELEKPRPQWFSSNLLQKSTSGPDSNTTTVTVPPKNLG